MVNIKALVLPMVFAPLALANPTPGSIFARDIPIKECNAVQDTAIKNGLVEVEKAAQRAYDDLTSTDVKNARIVEAMEHFKLAFGNCEGDCKTFVANNIKLLADKKYNLDITCSADRCHKSRDARGSSAEENPQVEVPTDVGDCSNGRCAVKICASFFENKESFCTAKEPRFQPTYALLTAAFQNIVSGTSKDPVQKRNSLQPFMFEPYVLFVRCKSSDIRISCFATANH